MDGSFDVEAGLKIARSLLVELVNMGLPLATEAVSISATLVLLTVSEISN
jgi:phospho-2-dehydro-3-deoxyheptonate aldolase